MRFKTIEEYDKHINDLNHDLKKFKKYVEAHPEKIGVQGNYNALKYLREELVIERNQFKNIICDEEFNIHISGEDIKNHSISSSLLIEFIKKYEDLNLFIAGALKFGKDRINKINTKFRYDFGFNVKPFSVGSFVITFTPKVYEDNQTTLTHSLNKQSFDKLCEFISYGENLDELKKQSEILGIAPIIKYRELLGVISKSKIEVSMNDKRNNKSSISSNKAKQIYNSLKELKEEDIETEDIKIEGNLYSINTDVKTCGIKYIDKSSKKTKKLPSVKFNEALKESVKNNLERDVYVNLKKTITRTIDDEKVVYDLVEIL